MNAGFILIQFLCFNYDLCWSIAWCPLSRLRASAGSIRLNGSALLTRLISRETRDGRLMNAARHNAGNLARSNWPLLWRETLTTKSQAAETKMK